MKYDILFPLDTCPRQFSPLEPYPNLNLILIQPTQILTSDPNPNPNLTLTLTQIWP